MPEQEGTKSNLLIYAERELRSAGWFDRDSSYAGMVGTAVMELLTAFAAQGHSGGSAPLVAGLFSRLAAFKPLGPIQDPMKNLEIATIDTEERVFQSARLFSLFSNDGGFTWHDMDAKRSWWEKLIRRPFHRVRFPYLVK